MKHVSRTGLYIFVILILLYTCDIDDRTRRTETKIDNMIMTIEPDTLRGK